LLALNKLAVNVHAQALQKFEASQVFEAEKNIDMIELFLVEVQSKIDEYLMMKIRELQSYFDGTLQNYINPESNEKSVTIGTQFPNQDDLLIVDLKSLKSTYIDKPLKC
jgi:hypothetical protein